MLHIRHVIQNRYTHASGGSKLIATSSRSVQNMEPEATAAPKVTSLATIARFLWLSTKPKMLINEGGLLSLLMFQA